MTATRTTIGAVLVLVLVALASVPFWASGGVLFLFGLFLINGLFALSWHLLFGYTGLASFGHAGFFAIGAYLVGAGLRFDFPVPYLVLLLAASAFGAMCAYMFGQIALGRLSGIFLAVLTVAFSEIVRKIISYTPGLGGEDGLSNIRRPVLEFGILAVDVSSSRGFFLFMLVAVGLATGGIWWLVHSRYGRAFACIRDNPERAEFLGISLKSYRLLSFVISGGTAAFAGGLFAPWTQIVTLDEIHWLMSLQPILNTFLGGLGSFWGPYVGAAAFMLLSHLTRTWAGMAELLVGGSLLFVILLAPTGIIGGITWLLGRVKASREGSARPERPELVPSGAAAEPRQDEKRYATRVGSP